MKKLILFFLILTLLGISNAACDNLINFNSDIPNGFGAPYDVFNPSQLLMEISCTSSSASIEVGYGNANQYIYQYGYVWKNSNWERIELNGEVVGGAWIIGSSNANLPNLELGNENYVLSYICTWDGVNWNCGCRDSSCSTNYWQLQVFKEGEGNSGGNDNSGNIGDLNSQDQEYLDKLIQYADLVLEKGRDDYGPKKTPVFVDTLDVVNHEPYRWISHPDVEETQEYGSEWIPASLSMNMNLFMFYKELSRLTGDSKYKNAADDAVEYYLTEGRIMGSANIVPWGHHTTYDALGDSYAGLSTPIPLTELNTQFPNWKYMYSVNVEGTDNQILTYLTSTMVNWRDLVNTRHVGAFRNPNVLSRTSEIQRNAPVPIIGSGYNMNYYPYGAAMADVAFGYYLEHGDERAWVIVEEYFKRLRAMRYADGTGPDKYAFQPGQDLTPRFVDRYTYMPAMLLRYSEQLGSDTQKGRMLEEWALDELHAFENVILTWKYPAPQEFWGMAYGYSLTEDEQLWDGIRTYLGDDKFDYATLSSTPGVVNSVSNNVGLWELEGMNYYLGREGRDRRQAYRNHDYNGYTIDALVRLYWTTGDEKFLDIAQELVDELFEKKFDNGLFTQHENGLYSRIGDPSAIGVLSYIAARSGNKFEIDSVFPRRVYLRTRHAPVDYEVAHPWYQDKAWDDEIFYCVDKTTGHCDR